MPLCQHCLEWAPKTREQLFARRNDSPEPGDKNAYMKCPECGGTDWVYTGAKLHPKKLPLHWWSRLYWRLRYRGVPLWPTDEKDRRSD